MTCEECAPLLVDSVDEALCAADDAALREHLQACAECVALLEDLRAIRNATRALDHRTPAPEAWKRIAAKTVSRRSWMPSAGLSATSRGRFWVPRIAAAALLIIAVGTGAWQYRAHRPAAVSTPREEDIARNANDEIREAEVHYDKAIAALEQLTAGQQAALDPQVASAIAQSLATIDRAIADSRRAVHDHPDSTVAQASLLEALRTKVSLLEETMSLVNSRS
jgi:hypothetical protein